MRNWVSRFIGAIAVGGDPSDLAEVRRARLERERKRKEHPSLLRRLFRR
jgi:hypothetical protein